MPPSSSRHLSPPSLSSYTLSILLLLHPWTEEENSSVAKEFSSSTFTFPSASSSILTSSLFLLVQVEVRIFLLFALTDLFLSCWRISTWLLLLVVLLLSYFLEQELYAVYAKRLFHFLNIFIHILYFQIINHSFKVRLRVSNLRKEFVSIWLIHCIFHIYLPLLIINFCFLNPKLPRIFLDFNL